MSTKRTWEVHWPGWKHPQCVKAVSSEQACDMVSRSYVVPRNELRAHPREPREGDSLLSEQFRNRHEHELYLACATGLYEVVPCSDSREIDAQAWQAVLAYRARCQPEPIPDGGPTAADMRGEEKHD
jgi:hypothetical protein